MRRWIIASLLICGLVMGAWAEMATKNEPNTTGEPAKESNVTVVSESIHAFEELRKELKQIESSQKEGNIWTKIYSNYLTYQNLKMRQETLTKTVRNLRRIKSPTDNEKVALDEKEIELQTIKSKLALLAEFQEDPFKRVVAPPAIDEAPKVHNPFSILGAISYKKKLVTQQKDYEATYVSLLDEIKLLQHQRAILEEMLEHRPGSVTVLSELDAVKKEIDTFRPVLEIFKTTKEVYVKKIEEVRLSLDEQIRQEIEKTLTILAVLLFFVALFFFFKHLVRRYMSETESYYTINKALNFVFLTILLLVILFAYIENVSYLVTVIGFASAGIAIAMKDWFMSLMGWWTIVIGGAVHVGDRVKFVRDGVAYVGDIVDISVLRMTMQEDVTLTTFNENRRSGRIIFIPNNYVFTDMIANYSHSGLKTVWDGIDFVVTFDSNIPKATAIAKEVAKKYSKGYTDITRKQLNKLRSHYHLKNTNVEPRVFSFIEPYGMKISAWYLTNAFATLTLRSTISAEIIEQLQQADDITIAFPTQSLYFDKNIPRPMFRPPQVESDLSDPRDYL